MASILLSSTLIDLRGIYCNINNCPIHGPLHTFLGAVAFALLIVALIYLSKNYIKKISKKLKLEQDYSLKSIFLGAIIGTAGHVLLDSFMHNDLTPFWPILENPLLGIISNNVNYGITIFGFIIGGLIYFIKLVKRKKLKRV